MGLRDTQLRLEAKLARGVVYTQVWHKQQTALESMQGIARHSDCISLNDFGKIWSNRLNPVGVWPTIRHGSVMAVRRAFQRVAGSASPSAKPTALPSTLAGR